MASARVAATCFQPGLPSAGSTFKTGVGRCSMNGATSAGEVTTAHQPCVELVQDGAVHLPYLQVTYRGLDGPADVSLVGRARGHVPGGDRGLFVQQFGHEHAGFRIPAIEGSEEACRARSVPESRPSPSL